MRGLRGRTLAAATVLALASAGGGAAAVQQLPLGGAQVNDDPAAGINPADSVPIDPPANADVVGGALVTGAKAVPWAIFRQTETSVAKHDQVFVRSFASGAWMTRGSGTVGGVSSATPIFSGSLNFDQGQDAEVPAIDFAGSGRTVPWATWYEHTAELGGVEQIFASRFDNTGDGNQGNWIFSGQTRGGATPAPSLNIHTNEAAENPSVAGGSTADPTKPGPWITWQETGASAPGTGKDQIFVVKPIGPSSTDCTGVKPTAQNPATAPLGGFCWQQVGVERLGGDPSLNVDRTRAGVEPDIAFTGSNDTVPWVVWYEEGNSGQGLHNNDMVFAAKGVPPNLASPPTGTVDGGFNWIAVGRGGSGVLDGSGTNLGGPCGDGQLAEGACSLNANASADAEDPRVATGTMTDATPTAPWVVWDESSVGGDEIFVAHLVSGQFVLANNNQPVGSGVRPDITFSGHTPYITWHHSNHVETGHFTDPNTFVVDNPVVGTSTSSAVRAPISSTCTANPFNGDGSSCQGSTLGTPFFLFSDGSPVKLFGDAYAPAPVTGATTGITTSGGTVRGLVNPGGTPAQVGIQFGKTTAYGRFTAQRTVPLGNTAVAISGVAGGFSPGTLVHYRAFATNDFGTVVGIDRTFRTATPPAPRIAASIHTKSLRGLLRAGAMALQVSLNQSGSVAFSGTASFRSGGRRHTISPFIPLTAHFRASTSRIVGLHLTAAAKQRLKTARSVTFSVVLKATNAFHKQRSTTLVKTLK